MSRAHAGLFFLDSQSKRTLLGILQAQLSDFYTGNSTRNFGKLNWFTLGELQRGQRVETKTANSRPRERIPSFLAGCACVDPICAYVYVHASHLRAESSTLSVHLIFFLEKWENQDLAHSPLERTGQATSDQVQRSAAGCTRGLVSPGYDSHKYTCKIKNGVMSCTGVRKPRASSITSTNS